MERVSSVVGMYPAEMFHQETQVFVEDPHDDASKNNFLRSNPSSMSYPQHVVVHNKYEDYLEFDLYLLRTLPDTIGNCK